jgi:hypothetical protein
MSIKLNAIILSIFLFIIMTPGYGKCPVKCLSLRCGTPAAYEGCVQCMGGSEADVEQSHPKCFMKHKKYLETHTSHLNFLKGQAHKSLPADLQNLPPLPYVFNNSKKDLMKKIIELADSLLLKHYNSEAPNDSSSSSRTSTGINYQRLFKNLSSCEAAYLTLRVSPKTYTRKEAMKCFDACVVNPSAPLEERKNDVAFNSACYSLFMLKGNLSDREARASLINPAANMFYETVPGGSHLQRSTRDSDYLTNLQKQLEDNITPED